MEVGGRGEAEGKFEDVGSTATTRLALLTVVQQLLQKPFKFNLILLVYCMAILLNSAMNVLTFRGSIISTAFLLNNNVMSLY